MAELNIKIFPDPILRKKARQVAKVGDDERKLAYGMIETMRSANGVGLAAPQIGVGKRIIVVEDIEGDKKGDILTLPIILGINRAILVTFSLLLIPLFVIIFLSLIGILEKRFIISSLLSIIYVIFYYF